MAGEREHGGGGPSPPGPVTELSRTPAAEGPVAISYVRRDGALAPAGLVPRGSLALQALLFGLPVAAMIAAALAGAISGGALVFLLAAYAVAARALTAQLVGWRIFRTFSRHPRVDHLAQATREAIVRVRGRISSVAGAPAAGRGSDPVFAVRGIPAKPGSKELVSETRAMSFWLELSADERALVLVEGAFLLDPTGVFAGVLSRLTNRRRRDAGFAYRVDVGDEVEVVGVVDQQVDPSGAGSGRQPRLVPVLRSGKDQPLLVRPRKLRGTA